MQWIIPVALIVISILPLMAFFRAGLPLGHDAQDHVVRIANFYSALSEGIIVPRWAGNLNWGYGHPVLMFLYPLSSYTASLFHFIGFSFVDATKAVFILAYIASLLSMYLWMSTVWGKRAGVIGALLYGFAPYRFVDMYVRMAIGEHMAFVFPPLIMYFFYKLSLPKNKDPGTKNYIGIGLSFSFAAFILSHNAIVIMFLPVFALYGIYLFFTEAKKSLSFILYLLSFIMLGFGLSAFFWVPAFFEGKYTLREIVTAGEAMYRFVPWTWFIYSPWNYGGTATLTKSLGIPQWIGITSAIILMWKTRDKKLRWFLSGSCLLLVASLFIMTPSSEIIWKNITLLQNFQFPWRFLSVSVFFCAVLGGIGVAFGIQDGKFKIRTKNILFVACCICIVLITIPMWHPKDYLIHDESFYSGIYSGTTDTGESSPIWTTRFMEHTAPNPMEVISGEALIESKKRMSTFHEYHVTAKTRAELLENTLFFPGWQIRVDGIRAGIQYQDPNHRGLMTFWIDEGEHTVQVKYADTKLRTSANYISIGSIILLGLIGIGTLLWIKRR